MLLVVIYIYSCQIKNMIILHDFMTLIKFILPFCLVETVIL